MARIGDGGDLLKCSFCGKSQKQVKKLIAGPGRLHLRRVHRPLQRDHRRGAGRVRRGAVGRAAQADGDLRVPRRLRGRPGPGQEGARGRGLQPLQAGPGRGAGGQRGDSDAGRAGQVQHPADRPDRLRQDPPGADPGPDAQRPVRDRRRHRADRGRLRRRGRREHPAQADPGRRLRHQARRDRHHLHRRDRQDRPQVGEPVDHPGRLRRGRAAGAAEDPRGHGGERAAAGRAQAPAPGVHPDRHHQRAVHLRWRLRRAGADHRAARRARAALGFGAHLRSVSERSTDDIFARSCRRTCSSSA